MPALGIATFRRANLSFVVLLKEFVNRLDLVPNTIATMNTAAYWVLAEPDISGR